MVVLHEAIKPSKKQLFENLFNDLKKKYQFDICLLIMFDDNKNYATVIDSFTDNKVIDIDKNPIDLINTKSLLNLMLNENKIIICNNKNLEFNNLQYEHLIKGITKEIYVPVTSLNSDSDDVIGCIYLATFQSGTNFDNLCQNDFIESFSTIYYVFNMSYEKYREKRKFLSLVNIFCEIYKNQYLRINHPFNVGYWSLQIAEELKFNELQKNQLYLAAILHDIGTLLLPQRLINKNDKLTDEEYELLKMHSIYGSNIIKELESGMDLSDNIDKIVKYHHERYDGMGYPEGLKGEEIPLFSRIIAVADSVDGMLSNRNYKTSMSLDKVIREFSAKRNQQFDPKIADIIINILIKQKKDIESTLGVVMWGTLVISTKAANYDFQGNLIKRMSGYEFISNETDFINNKDFKQNEITGCSLVVEKGGKLYEYDVKFNSICTNKFCINDIKLKPANQYFSMYWDLIGEIKENNLHISDIAIKQVGGNLVKYCTLINDKNKLALNKVYTLKIIFEDGEIINISGENIRTYKSSCNVYYEFVFTHENENVRDKIFRKIFSKHIQLRQLLAKAGCSSVV